MKTKLLIIASILFYLISTLSAQEIELEKTQPLTQEIKDGSLMSFSYNATDKTYTLIYITKLKSSLIKFETLVFDYNFNLITDETKELTKEQAVNTYSWFNYHGDEYTIEGVSINSGENLILKKKEITFTYNWNKNRYKSKSKTSSKVKLRNDDGSKYHLISYFEDDNTGGAYALCGVKSKTDKQNQLKDIHLLSINKDCDVVKDVSLKFDFPQSKEFGISLADENEMFNGYVYIFHGNADEYTFVRLDKNLNIIDRIPFNSPHITIDDLYWTNETMIFYGHDSHGNYFLTKVLNHEIDYATISSVDDLAKNLQYPPSQKKGKAYDSKNNLFYKTLLAKNGNFFQCGQDKDITRIPGQEKIIKYKDCFLFHFDNEGKPIAQYVYDIKWGQTAYPTDQYLFEGKSGNNIYWLILPQAYLPWPFDFSTYFSAYIGKIDTEKATIQDFLIFDYKRVTAIKEFYLDWNFPFITTDDGKLVLLGKDRPKSCGNTLYFVRINLD